MDTLPTRRIYRFKDKTRADNAMGVFERNGQNPELEAPKELGGTSPDQYGWTVYYDGPDQLPYDVHQPKGIANAHHLRPEYWRDYGSNGRRPPEFDRCAVRGLTNYTAYQCQYKAKHDPDHTGKPTRCGHHCRAVGAKKQAARDQKHAERRARIDARQAEKDLRNEALVLIGKIATGHNDPRGAAIELLTKYKKSDPKII